MNKPEIRLQGFEGEWEKVRLGDVAPVSGGYAFQSKAFSEYGIPIVRISNILESGVVGGDFAKHSMITNDINFKLFEGDVVIAMSGATTGKVAKVKTQEYLYQNQRVGKFTRTNKINYDFLSTIVNSKSFLNKLNSLLTSSAQPNASASDIDSICRYIPQNKTEQQAIASYFLALDRQIASAEKKVASLKQVKAASLQSMFPQEGETVPKVRFKGFDGEWKKVKLGDVAEIAKGQNLQSKDFVKGNIPVIAGGQSYAGTHNKSNQKGNCITISASGAYAGYVWYHNYPIFASDCSVVKGSYRAETLFLYYILKWKQSNIYKSQTGGAQPHIHPKDIVPIEFFLPSLPEQQAIASYFTALDKQIALHAQRLEKLRQIKSACLNKMFV